VRWALLLVVALGWGARASARPAGWSLYDRYCLACHGAAGDGKGPGAAFAPERPRDLTRGDFEWRSTPVGQPPTDDDLRATIRFGAEGAMPGFDAVLTPVEIERLVEVVKDFSPRTFAAVPRPVSLGPAPKQEPDRGAYLWGELGCVKCHGADGRGGTIADPPYDLSTGVRRPRATDDLDSRRRATAMSIATGMAGTAMPGYAGQVSDGDLWALADHVLSLARPHRAEPAIRKSGAGAWDTDEAIVWGAPPAEQGPPPASLAPAEASASERQCARCHAKQAREWQPSLHAAAASIGLAARLSDHAGEKCERCHSPSLEAPAEGVTCAGCHLREWVRRGPPRSGSLLAAPGYPMQELAIYERADFCMPCHQLPASGAVAGKPPLDTYREWLNGPYMPRGIECQHCHMSNREHQWLGVHDKETFRQGIELTASAHEKAGAVTVVASVKNIGAGHMLPTTATPAAWLRIELVDAGGRILASDAVRIGRDLDFDGTWHERSDTRIPPGQTLTMARAWVTDRGAKARISVEVAPDAYYEKLYAARLTTPLPAATRTLYETALARARSSHYLAEQREVLLSR
jgi:mono/diheme cytochrome c family protein